MNLEEAQAVLDEFGVHEPGLQGVIRACYGALDLITFLTTGEDETRSWEVRRGATAPEAAGAIHTDPERGFLRAEGSGVGPGGGGCGGGGRGPEAAGAIHTDLERGFIRAEVIGYDELVEAGSMEAGKKHGKGRGEGEDHGGGGGGG